MTDTQIMTMTDRAAARVKSLLGKASEKPLGLRIGITNTGCNGLSYTMDYASDQKPDDAIVDTGDITLLIDHDAVQFVAGTEMDWLEEGMQSRFTFENPNEKGRCGCGSSFHV
ncbi:iron-sulfur cluster assembly accessory protein [Sneathiella sp.]|uniref:HesB/IscA family protein n=1 Tax=Sneathiella sp. TaxID=1964365 RepID=UPI002601BACE|nr:iron-sulfur cluster assembly accessory protein [Sneathiella sp.]MDF2367844.1 iron-sulfur cluster assembly accessory protein [Sneathiella sp.]